jgi:DnaJ-class molecular chaperone
MAAPKDFYKTLGVAESAGADEIKKAYRKLAKKYHPDVTGGDKAKESRFKDATEAYEVLGDDKKRAAYDEQRRNPFAGRMPGGGGPGGGFQGNVDLGDLFSQFKGGRGGGGGGGSGGFSDIFEMFGGQAAQQGRRGPRRGEDIVARFEIDLPDAALGGDKEIIVEGRHLKIKIPPGVTDGKTIRLAGQGQPGSGRGAPAGDLLIELHEKPHARFRRRAPGSADIDVDLPIPVEVAILGGKADVVTLEGTTVSLTVPPGTSSGRQLRLRGKGAYVAEATRGDLFAVASVHVPSEIPPEAKDLIVEFARLTKK